MDILLGGIPRSGTTALARGLARHPDVFCWSSETGLLPRISEIIHGQSINPESADRLRVELIRQLRASFIEMPNWNAEHGQADQHTSIDEADVPAVADEIVSLLVEQRPRLETLTECAQILRRLFQRYTDKRMVAEKTPSNVLLFSEPARLNGYWAMTHRDPFAVIASMLARVGKDPWASDFAGTVERRIGLYNAHAEQVARAASDAGRSFVVGYDRLLRDPIGVMANLCCMLQLEPSREFLVDVSLIVGGEPEADHWQQYTPLDRWKIISLCRRYMDVLGYDELFYGATFASMLRPLPKEVPAEVFPMYGVSDASEGKSDYWASPKATFAVYAPTGANSVTFNLYNRVDQLTEALDHLGRPHEEYVVEAYGAVRAGSPEPDAVISLDPAVPQTFKVDLGGMEPVAAHAKYRLYQVELRANFSYAPFALLPDNNDVRNLSYIVANWKID